MPDILNLPDIAHPAEALLEECLERLRAGAILAGPTDTLYGLFCDPFHPEALARLVALKGERTAKPIPLLVAGPILVARLAATVPPLAERLMSACWPGGLTIVLPARPSLPEALTAGTGSVGLRQPATPYLVRLMEALDGPLTGTSANRTGERPATTAADVVANLGDEVGAVIDGGRAERWEGSTVVEVTEEGYRLLREGVVSAEALAAVTRCREEP